MNGVRADLIQAIIAAPDDDAPRLVLADWLEENGGEDQAEFIRVQIALANPPACEWMTRGMHCERWNQNVRTFRVIIQCPTCKRIDAQRIRSRELANIIQCPLKVFHCDRWEWVRGCVEEVTCSWDCWREHHAAILETNPIRKVTLTSVPDWDYVDSDMIFIEFMGVIYNKDDIGMQVGDNIPTFMLRIVWPKIRFHILRMT